MSALDAALGALQLPSAATTSRDFGGRWTYPAPPAAHLQFHVVAQGRCWVALDGGEKHWVEASEVIVVPFGHRHALGGTAASRIGTGSAESSHPLFDSYLRALPPLFVARVEPGAAPLHSALKCHLATSPAVAPGWFDALDDPVLAPALAAIHAYPEAKWTLTDLASIANSSRTALDDRFRAQLGRTAIRYLNDWRMHVAEELLAEGDLGVGSVARRVGYDAEEAFSRAFRRCHGVAPSVWRAEHAAASGVG